MPFWIDHPWTQGGPVSILRKIAYEAGNWMQSIGGRLEDWALYCKDEHPHGDPDDLPF